MNSKYRGCVVLFVGVCLMLLVGGFGIGCGDDSGPDSIRSGAPECWEGLGECGGAQMCKRGDCVSIQGQRFRLTVESGVFPEAKNYYLRVRDRDDGLLMETSVSSNTRTPSWYEATTITVQNLTDWWTVELRSEGFLLDSSELGCRFDFEPPDFEVDSRYTCGGSAANQFVVRIEPL